MPRSMKRPRASLTYLDSLYHRYQKGETLEEIAQSLKPKITRQSLSQKFGKYPDRYPLRPAARRVPPEKIQEVLDLSKEGYTQRYIESWTGLSRQTIGKIIKQGADYAEQTG